MATLYQTAATTRKVLIGFLVFAILVLVYDIVQRAPRNTVQPINPNRCYLAADNSLGKIDVPVIPGLVANRQSATYVLESFYSSFPDVSYVYQIERPREKLFVFETAQRNIENYGFNSIVFNDLGENNFEWISEDQTRVVKFNKFTQKWELTTSYEDNLNAIRRKSFTRNIEYYERQLERLISESGWDISGMDEPLISVKYAKLDNGIFTEKTTPQEADYVFANAYRKFRVADLKARDDLPDSATCKVAKNVEGFTYSGDPRSGQLKVIASENFSDYANDLYEMYFTNFEYGSRRGSYSITTPDEAWTLIQNGGGSLVSLLPQNFNYFADYPENLAVRKFTADRSKTVLGYYEPKDWTGFTYPIYIFEGRAELTDGRVASFIFFIDALKR